MLTLFRYFVGLVVVRVIVGMVMMDIRWMVGMHKCGLDFEILRVILVEVALAIESVAKSLF